MMQQKPISLPQRKIITNAIAKAKTIGRIAEIVKNERIPVFATHPLAPETTGYMERIRKPEAYAEYRKGVFEFLVSIKELWAENFIWLKEPLAEWSTCKALGEKGLTSENFRYFYSMSGEIIDPNEAKKPDVFEIGGRRFVCITGPQNDIEFPTKSMNRMDNNYPHIVQAVQRGVAFLFGLYYPKGCVENTGKYLVHIANENQIPKLSVAMNNLLVRDKLAFDVETDMFFN